MGSELKKLFQPTATEQLYLKHYYNEQENELPADNPYFFPLVLVRHVTETDNLHTQVTQHKYTTNTSNITHKQSKQTENNKNCETLGLFILLSAEIWITVMKND